MKKNKELYSHFRFCKDSFRNTTTQKLCLYLIKMTILISMNSLPFVIPKFSPLMITNENQTTNENQNIPNGTFGISM